MALAPPRLDHPVRLSDYLGAAGATVMIQRALNCVDSRLVDHGLRVGAIMDAMLEAAGWEPARRRDACLMALMHDIGAYCTEEIDRLVEFESCDVWEHSFYGYLFFKELSPLAGYAEVVLYHHMPYRLFTDQDPAVRFLAQVLQVADRVDMLLLERPRASAEEVAHALGSAPAGQFSFEATALFQEAERRAGLLGQLRGGFDAGDALRKVSAAADPDAAAAFLDMLVHVIDFRSRHTVTHTVTTAWTAYEIARRLIADEAERGRVYCAALLHDVGKAEAMQEKNGVIHAYGHEMKGMPLAQRFIRRLTNEKDLCRYVVSMVELHMKPNLYAAQNSRQRAWNTLFDQSVCPEDLMLLAKADHLGRANAAPYEETEREMGERFAAFQETMARPYVTGADLIARGMQPGEEMGKMLEAAHRLRLAGVGKEAALRQLHV